MEGSRARRTGGAGRLHPHCGADSRSVSEAIGASLVGSRLEGALELGSGADLLIASRTGARYSITASGHRLLEAP